MSKTLPTLIATLALSGCLIKNEPNPPVAPSIRIKHPVAQICDKILGSPMDPAIITEEMFTPENGWDT
jgi:hypothetical protein